MSNIRDDPLAIVTNILGVVPWPMQKKIITEFYSNPYFRELILCAGRRSSKSFLAAMIGHIETYRWLTLPDPWAHYNIHRGVTVYGLITAVSREQARDYTFMYYKTLLRQSWWYKGIDCDVDDKTLSVEFPGRGLTIKVAPSTSASQVGGTLLFGLLDEIARFVNTKGQRSGDEVHTALSSALETLNGVMVCMSSPIFVRDKIMRLIEDAKKEKKKCEITARPRTMLSYHSPTWDMNPDITRESLQPKFDRDPETAWREWGARPSYAIEAYFMEPEKIVMDMERKNPTITDKGEVLGLERKPEHRYYLHGDPAFKNDAFGIAVAHMEKEKIPVIDLIHREVPLPGKEIDALKIKKVLLNIHDILKLKMVTFDTWNYPETVQALKDKKLTIEHMVIKKEHYDTLKEQIYSGNISIPFHKLPVRDVYMPDTVVGELRELELKNGQKVDHPTDGSKDVADAVAGAIYMAYTTRRVDRNRGMRAGGRR